MHASPLSLDLGSDTTYWNRPSALLSINRRLFYRSTVGSFADQPSETNTGDEP
jgi:hypothetical protein